MKPLSVAAIFVALLTPAAAQRIVDTHNLGPQDSVRQLRPAADTNNDGIDDFVAVVRNNATSGSSTYRTLLIDGGTGAILWQLGATQSLEPLDILGFGDGDGDGRGDVAVTLSNTIVYSGATGAAIYTQNQRFRSMCPLGDYDGNGRADFAGAFYNNNGQNIVMLLRGENAAPFQSLPPIANPGANCTLRNVGDVTGDNRDDLALCPEATPTVVLDSSTGLVAHTLNIPGSYENGRTIETIDLDGDGKREVLVLRPSNVNQIEVHGGAAGLLRFTVSAPPGGPTSFARNACAVGDLNADGFVDFVSGVPLAQGVINAFSGSNGDVLWSFSPPAIAELGSYITPTGDVDGDGFADFISSFGSLSLGVPPEKGWHVISSKIVAAATNIGGACGAGPFLPRLGMSRPILGQTTTIALQDGPPGVNGVLAFSLQPPWTSYLGVSTCEAGFDMGNAAPLYLPTQPNWTLPLQLPLVPQFAGLPIALQCFYSPTTGPLGLDLSNAIWARIGFQ